MESLPPSPPKLDVLILGATGPELRGLRAALGEKLSGAVRGYSVSAKMVGLGMPVAAVGAAKRIFQLFPRCVVHLGTAGVYPGQDLYRPHDVVVSTRHRLVDSAVLADKAAFPEPLKVEVASAQHLASGLALGGPRVFEAAVASPLAMTVDDDLAERFKIASACQVENCEAFAIAHACHMAEVPFVSVLGLTHVVGAHGREDWRQFERQSSISAAEVIVSWLAAGAPGLRVSIVG